MASKLSIYFIELINFKKRINFLEDFPTKEEDIFVLVNLRDDYLNWFGNIKEEKEFSKFGSLRASDFVTIDHIKNGGISTSDRYHEVKKLLEKEMDLRIEFFNRIETMGKFNEESSRKPNSAEALKNEKIEVHISYNIHIGKFIFNNNESVQLEGKQKDTADCLINAGKNIKVSWDEIHEKFKDLVADQDIPNPIELDARKRSVRTAVTEINNHTKEYLEPNKELIDVKNNEYWLQYEVDKGR